MSRPRSLFKALPNHAEAQKIVEKNFLPEETALGLEKLIKDYIKSVKGGKTHVKRVTYADKKRKSGSIHLDDEDEDRKRSIKKRKTSLAIRRTPKAKRKSSPAASSAQPSRKSTRTSNSVSYAEADSDDDAAAAELEEENGAMSSPVGQRISKSTRKQESPKANNDLNDGEDREDTAMSDENQDLSEAVHVRKEEAATEEEETESEREPNPSSLKEDANPSSAKKEKTPAKKAVRDQPARSTRQTRSTRT